MGCINSTAALLVIDMQAGLFTDETPRHEAEGVVSRINALDQEKIKK